MSCMHTWHSLVIRAEKEQQALGQCAYQVGNADQCLEDLWTCLRCYIGPQKLHDKCFAASERACELHDSNISDMPVYIGLRNVWLVEHNIADAL